MSEETTLDFNPQDQIFLSPEALRNETLQMLAQLELKKHRLRMELVANNMDGTLKLQNGHTIPQEIAVVDGSIQAVLDKFSSVLRPPALSEN